METRTLHLYTAKPTDARFRSLATLLSQQQPVNLSDISDLPQPDRQRPTRQQLRAERVELARALEHDRRLLMLTEPHGRRFPQELADIKADITRHEQRIAAIDNALGQEGGVQA